MLACNLAGMFAMNGSKTILIDSDLPQQSATDFYSEWSSRGLDWPLHLGRCENANQLIKRLKTAENSFDVAVIDTGGELNDIHDAALDYCDLILMPLRPNIAELKTNIDLLNELRDNDIRYYLVWNQYRGTKRHKQTIDEQTADGDIPMFGTPLPLLTAFEECQDDGKIVAESNEQKAIGPMLHLFNNINVMLGIAK